MIAVKIFKMSEKCGEQHLRMIKVILSFFYMILFN